MQEQFLSIDEMGRRSAAREIIISHTPAALEAMLDRCAEFLRAPIAAHLQRIREQARVRK